MVSPPPALDPGPVDFEDGLPDGERAVVPDREEHEDEVQDAVVEVEAERGPHAPDQVHVQLEALVLVFVVVLGFLVQDRDIDRAQNDVEISPAGSGQGVLHLAELGLPSEDVLLQVDLGALLFFLDVSQHLFDGVESVALVVDPGDAFLLEGQALLQLGMVALVELLQVGVLARKLLPVLEGLGKVRVIHLEFQIIFLSSTN